MVKTFEANPPPLLDLVALPEHFDYLEAVPAGEYFNKGIHIVLKVPQCDDDQAKLLKFMKRQVLKTDTCEVEIPELQFSSPEGKAKFATVMDFLEEMEHNLQYMTSGGSGIAQLLQALDEMKQGQRAFSLILRDPLGNSCVQFYPQEKLEFVTFADDPNVTVSFFTRNRMVNRNWDIPEDENWKVLKGEEGFNEFVNLLKCSNNIVGFTGAGISVESGIPAFRSPNKDEKTIWNTYNMADSVYEKYLHDEEARIRQWQMYYDLRPFVKAAQPNPSHKLFKVLHDAGKLGAVVTQNIDELHQKALVPASKVIELHGSSLHLYCLSCKARFDNVDEIIDAFPQTVKEFGTSPRCSACKNGILKFDTIYFGEPLNPAVVRNATSALEKADLVVVMGTALVVAPANNMVTSCIDRNIPVVLVNIGETFIDEFVTVLLNEKCGQVCAKVIEKLV